MDADHGFRRFILGGSGVLFSGVSVQRERRPGRKTAGTCATTLVVIPTFEGKKRASFAGPKRYGLRKAAPKEEDLSCAVTFARERLGFEPDAVQAAVLGSTAKRGILNCARQWGKSTVVAAKEVHRAYTQKGCLVLVSSPTERQSGEFMEKASGMLQQLGIRPRGDGHNRLSLRLPNGSRIVGLPGVGRTVRGFAGVSLLLIDEASMVADGQYKALRPMLAASGGDLWLMSTPCGKRGFFYHAWAHGGDRWARFSVKATECARISKDFLEEERQEMGIWFGQEYLCEFVDNELGVFDRDRVERALDGSVRPLNVGTFEEMD